MLRTKALCALAGAGAVFLIIHSHFPNTGSNSMRLLWPGVAQAQAQKVACVGDCNHGGAVTIEDVILMVTIALGEGDLSACSNGDANSDGAITIDEILAAVANALNGCPPAPTETPTESAVSETATPTDTPTVPAATEIPTATPSVTPTAVPSETATPTPSAAAATATPSPSPTSSGATAADAVISRSVIIMKSVSLVSDVVAAIVNGDQSGGAAGAGAAAGDDPSGGAAGSCPVAGTATKSGNLVFGETITLSSCTVQTLDGRAIYGGTVTIGLLSGLTANLQATFENQAETVILTASAKLQGTASVTSSPVCFLSAATLTLTNSTLSATIAPSGPTVSVNFQNTTVTVDNITFNTSNSSCVPTKYRLTLNGTAALLDPEGGATTVTFNGLVVDVDNSSSPALFSLSGGFTSPCFGGTVTLSTAPPLSVPSGQDCPTAGAITITLPSLGQAQVSFQSDGSVNINENGVDVTVPNCLDARLLMCLA
jgi:hypothetical protein